MKFLGRLITEPAKEWICQSYIVQEARRAGYTVTACQEQGKRSMATAGKAKASGMTAGVPDLLWWLPEGRLCGMELKTADGRLNDAQRQFHAQAASLGHSIEVIYANSPLDGWTKTLSWLARNNGDS